MLSEMEYQYQSTSTIERLNESEMKPDLTQHSQEPNLAKNESESQEHENTENVEADRDVDARDHPELVLLAWVYGTNPPATGLLVGARHLGSDNSSSQLKDIWSRA